MCIRIFDTAVLCYDRGRRLFSDARYAGDIVGCITHQCLDINKLNRCHLIFFYHFFGVVIFNLGSGALGLWDADLDPVCCKLQQITVA